MCETNLKCLICFQDCDNCRGHDSSLYYWSDLWEFAKYLNISTSKSETGEEVGGIVICDGCQILLKVFTKLLRALQIAQMKVDSCIKEIRDVMCVTDLDPGSGGCGAGSEKMRSFRNTLIQTSSSKLAKSSFQPVVKIQRTFMDSYSQKATATPFTFPPSQSSSNPGTLDLVKTVKSESAHDETMSNDADIELDDISIDVKAEPVPEINEDSMEMDFYEEGEGWNQEVTDHSINECKPDYDNSVFTATPEIQSRDDPVKNSETVENGSHEEDNHNHLACPFCRAVFTKDSFSTKGWHRGHGALQLRRHMLKYHCESFFPSHKLPTVAEADFRKILVELLFQDLVTGKQNCVFCPTKFSIPSKHSDKAAHCQRVKFHYVNDHFKELEERLKTIQEDPNLKEKLNKCNPFGRTCACGVYLENPFSLKAHTKLHCPLTEKQEYFLPRGSGPIKSSGGMNKEKIECKSCGRQITRSNIRKHMNRSCKGIRSE